MIKINNELELYSIKGNVVAGKLLLFKLLENKQLSRDQIKQKVVDEYEIMQPKHFLRSWKEYLRIKKFIDF